MLKSEKKIEDLKKQIKRMEENNDGSLQWVDDIRELYLQLDEAELMATTLESKSADLNEA